MTNTGNQSVAVDLYKCLKSGKVMVLYPSTLQKILQGGWSRK